MENTERAARRIFGERAASYVTSSAHTDAQVLDRVVELSAAERDWRALDVATGSGHTAFALAPHVRSVAAIDLTPEMLAEAKHLAEQKSIANVTLCEADVHHLPFGDGVFNLATCRRAAHHFSRIDVALGEMKRVLRHGGRLVIDDRSVPDDEFVDECMNQIDRLHDESHVRQYRLKEWVAMLERLGFDVERAEPYVKHRPLTSFTNGVSPENVRKIHDLLNRLDSSQKRSLNLTEVGGETHINHWYLMISAHGVEMAPRHAF